MFKNDLQSQAAAITNNNSGEKNGQNGQDKKYVPKATSKNSL